MRIERLELGMEELELGQPQEPGARIIALDLRERRDLGGRDELLLHREVEAPREHAQFLPNRAVPRSRGPSCRHIGIETGSRNRYEPTAPEDPGQLLEGILDAILGLQRP